MTRTIRALAFGLSLTAVLCGQSYQSSFSEVKYDRARTPATFHGGAEVDLPTGAVSYNVPLGPGIGARGLRYTPTLSTRFAPQVPPFNCYSGSNQVYPGGISCVLTPGYFVMGAGAPVHGKGSVVDDEYLLTDGGSGSGIMNTDPGTVPTSGQLVSLLSAFGITGTPSLRGVGGRGELIVNLNDGQDHKIYLWEPTLTYPNPPKDSNSGVAETLSAPGAIVVVSPDGAIATIFSLANAQFMKPFPGPIEPTTSLMAAQLAIGDPDPNDLLAVHYLPTRTCNRFGEQIRFDHFTGVSVYGVDFTATWTAHNGGSSSVTVKVISSLGASSIPGINGGGSPLTGAKIQVSYSEPKVSSYTVDAYAYFDWSIDSPHTWYTAMNSAWDRFRRNLQPTNVSVNATGESVQFGYQNNQTDNSTGLWTPVTLASLSLPNRAISFTWKPYQYRRPIGGAVFADYGVLPPAMRDTYAASGVVQVDDRDLTPGGKTRTTTYTRTVPVPDPNFDSGPNWTSTTFTVGVRHPDGRGTLTRYAEPLNKVVFNSGTWNDASKVFQALAYLKHIPTEIREYAQGVNFSSDTQVGGGGSAYRVVLYGPPAGSGRFDVGSFDNPYWSLKQVGNPSGTQGGTPYAIRTETWTPEDHRVESRSSWDATNLGWQTLNRLADLCAGSKTLTTTYSYESRPGTWLMGLVTLEIPPSPPNLNRVYNGDGTVDSATLNSNGSPSVQTKFTYAGLATPKTATLNGAGLVLSGVMGASYGFDAYGYVNSITPAASGLAWNYGQAQDSLGRPSSQTDPHGVITSFGYDGAGRLGSITPPPPESQTTITYDSDHLGVNITRGPQYSHLRYNGFGDLVSESRTTPNGFKTKTISYDLAGRRTFESVWGSSSTGTNWTYDSQGRPWTTTDPNGLQSVTSYNGCSRTVTVGGPGGPQTTFTKDSHGRLISVTDALGQVTNYGYDDANRVTSATQSGTQVRTWHYNNMGWLDTLTQPETGTTTYSGFTVAGKPTTTVYGAGAGSRTVSYLNPDPLGRPASVSASDGSVSQAFSYDKERLDTSLDQKVRLNFTYGGLNGRLSGLATTVWNTGPAKLAGSGDFASTQTFDYSNEGVRRKSTVDGRSQDVGLFDSLGLPKQVSYTGAGLNQAVIGTVTAVNDSGSPTNFSYANGASTLASYRPDGIGLASLGHTYAAGSRNWIYSYATSGRLAGMLTGDNEDSYDYDLLGRLTSATVKAPNPAVVVAQAYEYDAFGNPLANTTTNLASLPAGLQQNFADFRFSSSDLASNRIPARTLAQGNTPAGDTGRVYDNQGNLTYLFKQVNAINRWLSFQYDALGRITQMVDNERGITEKYFYTSEGLRTRIETYLGIPPQTLVLKKVEHRIYNNQRQLVSEYEAVAP